MFQNILHYISYIPKQGKICDYTMLFPPEILLNSIKQRTVVAVKIVDKAAA